MKAMEKIHGHHAKEYEKALKVFPFFPDKDPRQQPSH
jgi:hypothetical protein